MLIYPRMNAIVDNIDKLIPILKFEPVATRAQWKEMLGAMLKYSDCDPDAPDRRTEFMDRYWMIDASQVAAEAKRVCPFLRIWKDSQNYVPEPDDLIEEMLLAVLEKRNGFDAVRSSGPLGYKWPVGGDDSGKQGYVYFIPECVLDRLGLVPPNREKAWSERIIANSSGSLDR